MFVLKRINLILLFLLLISGIGFADTLYEDAEDGETTGWVMRDGDGYIHNEYAPEIDSRVIHLGGGDVYDLWLNDNGDSWNNTTERILSFRMKFTGTFLIYISVDTTDGHRWLFSNLWNGHYGYHGVGILNGYGDEQTHNSTWQTMVLDLDRLLHDTEPNLDIVRVNQIRFDLTTDGFVDDIRLDTPQRVTYEDGNHGIENWQISDNTPNGATMENILDDEEVRLRDENGEDFTYQYNDHVVALHGDGTNNAFMIGSDATNAGWNNRDQSVLQWKMRSSEFFEVIVHVDTLEGMRELHYTPDIADGGLGDDGISIHHALGVSRNGDGETSVRSTDGRWITYTRDLADDLRDYEPNNRLVSVNGMSFRGDTLVDDIQLMDAPNGVNTYPVNALYEDAQDGDTLGWSVFDNQSGTATITNIVDPTRGGSRVIRLEGAGTRDGYMLGERAGDGRWRNHLHDTLQWSMNYDEAFVVYISTETTNGERTLVYTATDENGGLDDTYIRVGLGADAADGTWRTFTRNIAQDIANAEPDNELISINAFLIRGSGRLDNIQTRASSDPTPDTTAPEIRLLGNAIETIPLGANYIDAGAVADDNIDGIITDRIVVNSDELNTEEEGVYRLFYNVRDHANNPAQEVIRTVHVLREQTPPTILEDAEDGTTSGWSVRDGSSAEASISNVFDAELGSRVIAFDGTAGTTDSYILWGDDLWNSDNGHTITWKMNFDESVVIYVLVHTTEGDRYLFYTPSPNTALLHGFTGGIHHGLSESMMDGRWRQITRNLDDDLHDAEPENTLLSVEAIIIRGHGRLDEIKLYNPLSITYGDGEHGTALWHVDDNTPEGASISVVEDHDLQGNNRQGDVISLQGDGFNNAYILGQREGAEAWNNREDKIIQWKFRAFGPEPEILSADPDERGTIRDPEAFAFRVSVETTQGYRELLYTLGDTNLGIIEDGQTIHHGLGDDRIRGSIWEGDDPLNILGAWHAVTRDLEEDIMDFEPDNRLVSINAFIVRNSGLVDDIKIYSKIEQHDRIYEDAEDGNTDGWQVYDATPEGATITNIMDEARGNRVIELAGDIYNNGYMLGGRTTDTGWNDQEHTRIRWSMNYNELFVIYIPINTTNGRRYMVYENNDEDRGESNGYIRFGLGANAFTGTWQSFERDIEADLHQFEPENELLSVDGFMIRGSGRLDDIALF